MAQQWLKRATTRVAPTCGAHLQIRFILPKTNCKILAKRPQTPSKRVQTASKNFFEGQKVFIFEHQNERPKLFLAAVFNPLNFRKALLCIAMELQLIDIIYLNLFNGADRL